ncbi:MAG: ACT domain-containing protein [Mycobacteriales bacterium]
MRLTLLDGRLAVCRLDPDEPVPDWAWRGPVASVTRVPTELSVVCAEDAPPDGVLAERGWRAYQVEGPMPFTLTGVVSGLTAPLAAAGIGVFVLSTYDTDYLLVKDADLAAATAALRAAGHDVQ